MSAHEFTAELSRRGWLAESLSATLSDKLADPAQPLSARDVADFLVQKKYLTQLQSTDALNALIVRGVKVDQVQADGGVRSDIILDEIKSDDDPSKDDASLFAPYLTPNQMSSRELQAAGDVDGDEFTLVPLESEDLPADDPRADHFAITAPVESSLKNRVVRTPAYEPVPPSADVPAETPPPSISRRIVESGGPSPQRKQPPKTAIRKSEWDSPLIFMGGGALLLLFLCGVTVWLLLRGRSVDEQLQLAKQAADQGAYAQAIELYETFVSNYSRHAERSTARVRLAMLRLRRDFESGELARALATAQEELPAVEEEEKFADSAHEELAAILPQLAGRLASRAEAAESREQSQEWIDRANAALALASNPKYIPPALADKAKIDEVRAALSRIVRRDQRQIDLNRALADMEAATNAGDTNAAYSAQRRLLARHPVLASNTALAERVKATTAAEKTRVRLVAAEQRAETNEPPVPWVASIALAIRRGGLQSPSSGAAAPVCVQVEGAVYGLESNSGRLLWRRFVGHDVRAGLAPSPVSIGNDVLVIDTANHALLRLDASTGQLRWRTGIEEDCARPLVAGNRIFLASANGRLYVIDLESGTRSGYVEFPQPLRTMPTADRQERCLYVVGEHSSLYCLSLADLKCLGVYYSGHAPGSVQVAPVVMQDKLAFVENDGVASCRLRLMSLDAVGKIDAQITERRLTGLAAASPLTSGRRLILVTDRGQLEVFELGGGAGDEVLSRVATRDATDEQPLVRHVAIADGHLWIADRQLTKHAVLPTGNRLPVVSTDNDYRGATFDHPLQTIGQTIFHAYRPKGRTGIVVGGMDSRDGRVLWETSLAIPLAGAPVVDEASQSITAVTTNGNAFRLDAAAIRAKVSSQPLVATGAPAQPPILLESTDLGTGRAAFSAPGVDRVLVVQASPNGPAPNWVSLPAPLACPVSRFGEGMIAPLAMGQVHYLHPTKGGQLAVPFQPLLAPGTAMRYTAPGVDGNALRQFVISDGQAHVYLVKLTEQPQLSLQAVAQISVGTDPIVSPMAIMRGLALGVTKSSRLASFRLPDLEPSGETQLSASLAWGPFVVNDRFYLSTSDGQLLNLDSDGKISWTTALEHGELVGRPLVVADELLIAYRSGVLERRSLVDGRSLASKNMTVPLTAGPALFLTRIVLASHDGTVLIVDRP